jgi:HD-GYP domain-containing protein (c-di-GMP phosphodiesterase class II)
MRQDQQRIDDHRNPRLRLLLTAIQRQEGHVADHSRRTQQIVLALGERLSLDDGALALLSTAAVLHDLGKFLVPVDILNKPGPLTRRERDIMMEHAQLSAWLCKELPWLHPVLPIVRGHHERLNGSGYPDKLAGSQIPLLTQILQLADVSDALLSPRPYRAACSLDQTAHILKTEAQRNWRDHTLTDTCLTILDHPTTEDSYVSRHHRHPTSSRLRSPTNDRPLRAAQRLCNG